MSCEPREVVLPDWWNRFIRNVAELPDRTSPPDDPDAMIATEKELGFCCLNAIETMNENEAQQ